MFALPRPLGLLAFLTAWMLPWRPTFRVTAGDARLPFYVHRRDYLGRHLAKYGDYEPEITRWISVYLAGSEARGLVIDVGANIGWHAIHAARHRSVDLVLAFEPDSFNAWLLDQNLVLNGVENAIVEARAVGAERGMVRLYRYKPSNQGRHSVLADQGFGSKLVAMTDLDSAVADCGSANRSVLLVKIDVEGNEPAVVAGAMQTLARAAVVILEFSPALSRAGGQSLAEMIDRLSALGLSPYRFGPADGFQEHALYDFGRGGQCDLFWIRDGHPASGVRASDDLILRRLDPVRLRQL